VKSIGTDGQWTGPSEPHAAAANASAITNLITSVVAYYGVRIALLSLLAACGTSAPVVEITIDRDHPGARIPDDFAGASYETSTVIGGAYFRADNAPLLATFAKLGLRHLRIGGNEADVGDLPAAGDIDALLAFADASHVPLIYTLRAKTIDPDGAAAIAHAMLDRDAARLECFSIGNEPDHYAAYADYRTIVTSYMDTIADARARYCGPDALPPDYVTQYATDFAPRGTIAEITIHEYFGGGGQGIAPADARAKLLSPAIRDAYAHEHDAWAPAIEAAHLTYRIDETNSFANGGAPGASDTFASTLWGLDYLHWWARAGAIGIDFHTGDHVSGATTTYPLFVTDGGGYAIRPLAYAVMAFELGSHGRTIPVTVDTTDLTAYAVVTDDGTIALTIISTADGPRTLHLAELDPVDAHRVTAPAIDATSVTFGEAESIGNTFTIDPMSAIVVHYR